MHIQPAEPMVIELTHFRRPGRVISTIQGWIEGDPGDILKLFLAAPQLELSALDPRLQGTAGISSVDGVSTRSPLTVSGPVMVDGRALEVGDQVRVTRGGAIRWNR